LDGEAAERGYSWKLHYLTEEGTTPQWVNINKISEGHVPREMLLCGESIHNIPHTTWVMVASDLCKGQFERVQVVLERELKDDPLVHWIYIYI